MSMLDEGPEMLLLWAETESTDGRGNIVRMPDLHQEPTQVRCWIAPAASLEHTAYGSTVDTVYTAWAADFPVGAWGLGRWSGRDWDIVGEVRRYNDGMNRVCEMTIRARKPEAVSGG